MKTAGTEFDENVENRPKKEEVSTRTGVVGVLSFAKEDSNEDDVEEIEGYRVVNVYNVIEENAAQMERPEPQAKWPKPTEVLEDDVEMEAEIREEPKSFIDNLKERSNTEELLEEIMDQKVSIRLKDIDELRL
jgi:hypothetical protein